jgi:Transglutaminase-like superfamily
MSNRESSIAALLGRYPKLRSHVEFEMWVRLNGISHWYEDIINAAVRVYVLAADERSLFTFDVDTRLLTPEAFFSNSPVAISGTQVLDTSQFPALAQVRTQFLNNFGGGRFLSARFQLLSEGVRLIAEHIDSQGRIFAVDPLNMDSGGEMVRTFQPVPRQRMTVAPQDFSGAISLDDALDSDDLHFNFLFSNEATLWVANQSSARDKAKRIGFYVGLTYQYDDTIPLILEFTWRDQLVRDQNGRRGVCDEFACVTVSYLRSIGIPAKMKMLHWYDEIGKGVGHSCVEFYDGIQWVHIDPLWKAFEQSNIYRVSGARNVTVMDADYPQDDRSNTPAWDQPDAGGDGKLNTYDDFIISPPYPGNFRPGYSY